MAAAVVHRINLFPLAIPFPRNVMRAASHYGFAGPVVVAVELAAGTVGYGETLPCRHITGETADSVLSAVRDTFAPVLMDFHPTSFPAALEAIEALPWRDGRNRLITSARAAVELALLDVAMRAFHRGIDDVVQWMGLPGFGSPGSLRQVRFSGLLSSRTFSSTLRRLRIMYWVGLRAFKLQVGFQGDHELLQRVAAYLYRPMAGGRATLRVDAEGSWTKDEAIEWLSNTASLQLAAVEQPLARGKEDELPILRDLFDVTLLHDESLVTMEDGRRLVELGVAGGFNIHIAKCGGMIPSLRLASFARRAGVHIQLGCMVSETSILSAVALRFLEVCPAVTWAERCTGSFRLSGDGTWKGRRFGYGGRLPRLRESGLGVEVDPQRLQRFSEGRALAINL